MLERYDNIVYDFDGTIADSYPFFTRALHETLEHFGIHDSYDSVLGHLKISVRHALNHYVADCRTEARKMMYEIYQRLALEEGHPIPGVPEALDFTIQNGGRNFLYTHSDKFPAALLERWGLLDKFTFIIDSTMKFPSKPAPDALNYLCERYSLNKDRTLMVGDRDIDVLAGLNAGVHGCLFDDGHFYDDFKCEHIIYDMHDMISVIGKKE